MLRVHGFRVEGVGFRGLGLRVQVSGNKEFGAQGSGDKGFGLQGPDRKAGVRSKPFCIEADPPPTATAPPNHLP